VVVVVVVVVIGDFEAQMQIVQERCHLSKEDNLGSQPPFYTRVKDT